MLRRTLALSCFCLLVLPATTGFGDELQGLGVVVSDFREAYVDDPFPYFVDFYPGTPAASGNPLPQAECTYTYVYSESGDVSAGDTILPVEAYFDTGVDWAFEIVLPDLPPCDVGYLRITWDAQAETPEYPVGLFAGIALTCEVEQLTADGLKVVPCPGTHVFRPFIIRNDSRGGGELAHCSYEGTMFAPATIDGDPPLGPPNNPVTVRFGFSQSHTPSPPYPINSRVANQNLMIEVGPSTLEAPPPPSRDQLGED
jgi:hypothetical protein